MRSGFGWTLLSKEALKRAETQLREDVQGVRDEIGFLALHQAYADRFFPGTSVLHTRLRYALFVPWLYQKLMERGEGRRIGSVLEREEIVLAGRLKKRDDDGVIGGRSYPKPTSQPASMVYWTALGTWRILRPLPNGTYPARSAVHRAFARGTSGLRLHDDDRQLLEESEPIFSGIPPAPKEWKDAAEPLEFALPPHEARFLRGCLLAVQRPGGSGAQSLLARLVEVPLRGSTDLWDSRIITAADSDDRRALLRASQAAALSAVGRAIYAALVESMRGQEDGLPTAERHRRNLPAVIERYRDHALELDVEGVRGDAAGGLPEGISTVLRETQAWLRRSKAPLDDLHPIYEEAELRRKGRRARLARTLAGRDRRGEWSSDEHPEASPLHYRWSQVRRLLRDLQAAP